MGRWGAGCPRCLFEIVAVVVPMMRTMLKAISSVLQAVGGHIAADEILLNGQELRERCIGLLEAGRSA